MRIEETDASLVSGILSAVESRVSGVKTLEQAAQQLVGELYERFDESIVIARAFVTVPFGSLPDSNREFVAQLVESAGAAKELKTATPVLSLVGTRGSENGWNDRRDSQGHVGIPLVSSSFVGAIPMISRLLQELGVPVDWVDSHDAEMIVETIGGRSSLFFVSNANDATDTQGRKIIAAQDFVSSHGVHSVFGVGTAYDTGQIFVLVAFCRDSFSRTVAEQFLPLVDHFRDATAGLVGQASIFGP
jgi:hypothetical protein